MIWYLDFKYEYFVLLQTSLFFFGIATTKLSRLLIILDGDRFFLKTNLPMNRNNYLIHNEKNMFQSDSERKRLFGVISLNPMAVLFQTTFS